MIEPMKETMKDIMKETLKQRMKQQNTTLEKIAIDSPIGVLILSAFDGAVCSIGVAKHGEEEIAGKSANQPVLQQAARELIEYFAGERTEFTFAMRAKGTQFQMDVWQKLSQIPYGETKTYGQIAKEIDNPKASRAVGMACNKNPIMIAVPCHRVVGSNGSLTGYAYGTEMKQSLLNLEQQKRYTKPIQ